MHYSLPSVALLRAEVADVWVNCPASAKYDNDNLEGLDAVPESVQQYVADRISDFNVGKYSLQKSQNVSDEHAYEVKPFLDDVAKSIRESGVFNATCGEQIFINDVSGYCQGNVDFHIYDSTSNVLVIWLLSFRRRSIDFKYRFALYTSELLKKFNAQKIEIRTFTPRGLSGNYSLTLYSLAELGEFVEDAKLAVDEIFEGQSSYNSGRHCSQCVNVYKCDVAVSSSVWLNDFCERSGGISDDPKELSVKLKFINNALSRLSDIKTPLESHIFELIMSGKLVPGWEVKEGRKCRVWNDDAVDNLKDYLKKPELITVRQAEIKGAEKELLDKYSEVKSGKLKLNEEKMRKI